jgi:hypothetical protein
VQAPERLRRDLPDDTPRAASGRPLPRIATLNVRHANTVRVSYRVPRLAPGRYVYVLYCGPCWRGPRGSLIAFDDRREQALTVIK